VVGKEGKQLGAQRIQCDAPSQSDLHKTETIQRNVQCVSRLAKLASVTQVRRECRRVFNEEPSHENNFRRWDRQLKETGSRLDKNVLEDHSLVTSLWTVLSAVRRNLCVNVLEN
jgi:hypothetical protein